MHDSFVYDRLVTLSAALGHSSTTNHHFVTAVFCERHVIKYNDTMSPLFTCVSFRLLANVFLINLSCELRHIHLVASGSQCRMNVHVAACSRVGQTDRSTYSHSDNVRAKVICLVVGGNNKRCCPETKFIARKHTLRDHSL